MCSYEWLVIVPRNSFNPTHSQIKSRHQIYLYKLQNLWLWFWIFKAFQLLKMWMLLLNVTLTDTSCQTNASGEKMFGMIAKSSFWPFVSAHLFLMHIISAIMMPTIKTSLRCCYLFLEILRLRSLMSVDTSQLYLVPEFELSTRNQCSYNTR